MNLQLTPRDVKLLFFIFKFKAVTLKQIEALVFHRSVSTVSKRLKKLRKRGLITVIGKDCEFRSSLIFGLTKYGFKTLIKEHPNLCLVERFKSNSINHDVTLVEIENILSSKGNVEKYWSENIIQCSRKFAEDDTLAYFRDFNFDGLIKFKTETNGSFIFGLEYESSQKGSANYKLKLSHLYSHSRPQVILYICKTGSIEKIIKKVESDVAANQPKKLYFIQYSELTREGVTLTFKNQEGKKIVIK